MTRHYFLRLLLCLLLCVCAAGLRAQPKTFVRDYAYQASEVDSKVTARANATNEMRNILLREIGEYLSAKTTVITKDDKQTLIETSEAITAGIVEMKILDERWDGYTYYIKAEMTVDPDEVLRRIDEVRNDTQKTKELEDARRRTRDAEAEIARLNEELKVTKDARQRAALNAAYQYQTGILAANDHITRGNVALHNGWIEEALEEYKKAYDQMPKDETTYLFMGGLYSKAGREGLKRSADCYKNYLALYPDDAEGCLLIGDVYKQLERTGDADYYYRIADRYYKNIVMGDHDNAEAYEKLSRIAASMGNGDEARRYSDRAKAINSAKTYTVSGRVTDSRGKPLAGVSIVIKNSSIATITNANGYYTIKVHDGDELSFSFAKFKTKERTFPGGADAVIDVVLQKEERPPRGRGLFLSYIYDNSPLTADGPMHGVSLMRFRYPLGWYASLRASSAFFQPSASASVPGSFAASAGGLVDLSRWLSLYVGPGVGSHLKPSDETNTNRPEERKREWYFQPEAGLAFNLRYVTLFGGLKYPLPTNEAYEKILWSAGAGINFGAIAEDLGSDDLPAGAFLSYIYDSNPIKAAGPMHGVSLFNFGDDDNRWGWYASFRANSAFFRSTPEPFDVPGLAFNAGPILKLFRPAALYFGPGVGNYAYTSFVRSEETGLLTDTKKQDWYFNPEIGIALNFHYVTLFGGLKYPLPTNEAYEKILWSAGAGFTIKPKYKYNDDKLLWLSYTPDIPVTSGPKNPPGFIGLTGGQFLESDFLGAAGYYVSFRGNALMFGGGGDDDSDRAHIAGSVGFIVSPRLQPLYLSVGIGGYWEWSKQSEQSSIGFFHWRKKTAYLMPEIGVHLHCFKVLLLSFGRAFPGFKNDKVIYTTGVGILLGDN